MELKKQKFTTSDLIMLGVFNATLLVIFSATLMVLHLIPLLWGAMDQTVNFILAPVFLLMLVRVPKVGTLTIHGTVIGIMHAVMGWWPGFFAALIAGLAADGVAYLAGGYRNNTIRSTAVLVFVSVKAFFFYAPLYLFSYLPWFQEVLTMWPKEYIEKYTFYYALGFLGVNVITTAIGLFLGNRLLNRHFKNTRIYSS